MDHLNRFATKPVFWILRAEYAAALLVCLISFVAHITEVRWLPAIALFLYIDVIGYLPGAIAFRRSVNGHISRNYYMLYNVMHSFATHFVVLSIWIALFGFEWGLLAVPIHLCGDRALFGNFLKAFDVPFEAVKIEQFAQFELSLAGRARRPGEPSVNTG